MSDETFDESMGPPTQTTNSQHDHQDAEEGMGPRAHTLSEGISPFPRFPGNYSANDNEDLLDRYRMSVLKKPLQPALDRMFHMSFEEWRVAEREKLPEWHCSTRRQATLADLKPFGSQDILAKVCVYRGGVTSLALDAIVNAANERCLGGGGVDGAIHDAAGPLLLRECCTFNGCATGQTRLTKGYDLPARFVLHTVGPIGERPHELESCYRSCLSLARRHKLRSIGFCCVSTGIFGYPLAAATNVALKTCLTYLNEFSSDFDLLTFACFRSDEEECYKKALPHIYREVLSTKGGSSEPHATTSQSNPQPRPEADSSL